MATTFTRNICSAPRQWRMSSPLSITTDFDVANSSRHLAVALFGALVVLMLSASGAHAKTDEAPIRAALSNATAGNAVIEMRGACRKGAAVFTVKNIAKRWAGRGHLRIYDGQTGHVLRERWMHFDEGQSASFHIQSELVASARFKISVTLPDRSVTYKKSFRGHCVVPTVEANNVVGNALGNAGR